jgi:hypothetical protein
LKDAWGKVAKDEGDQDYFFRFVLDDIEKFRTKPDAAEGGQPTPSPPPPAQTTPALPPAQTAQP